MFWTDCNLKTSILVLGHCVVQFSPFWHFYRHKRLSTHEHNRLSIYMYNIQHTWYPHLLLEDYIRFALSEPITFRAAGSLTLLCWCSSPLKPPSVKFTIYSEKIKIVAALIHIIIIIIIVITVTGSGYMRWHIWNIRKLRFKNKAEANVSFQETAEILLFTAWNVGYYCLYLRVKLFFLIRMKLCHLSFYLYPVYLYLRLICPHDYSSNINIWGVVGPFLHWITLERSS